METSFFLSIFFWALTFGVIGKVLLGITVMSVHGHIIKEHKIDLEVLKAMKIERLLALLGVIFIIVGYLLEVMYFSSLPF